MKETRINRRLLLAGATALNLLKGRGLHAQTAPSGITQGPLLIALFTRSHNSRVTAEVLRRRTSADLFEIVPRDPYPDDYQATVDQAERERETDYRPPLTSAVEGLDRYATVALCFPIWGGSLPPPVRSFLDGTALEGKTLVPMISHGGYGTGNAMELIRADATGATVSEPFVMEGQQERQVIERVEDWLS